MARTSSSRRSNRLVQALLDGYGRTYCQELGIDIARNEPSVLFRWLCATLLFSTRISARTAVAAARVLAARGWTTPLAMRATSWEERVRALDEAGYVRYDESMATKLADLAERLLGDYHGDLRELRERAKRDPAEEHRLVQEFRGIGPVGADIFCRDMQAARDELYPFVDALALRVAARLGLGARRESLARLVPEADFARFVTALVRVHLARAYDEVTAAISLRPAPAKEETS